MRELLSAGLIYALLAMDHIAVGQFMLCRPLVVGPLLGLFLGNAPLGLLAGAVTELLWVHVIPVGIWPIDTTSVAALSVTWSLLSIRPGRPAFVLALMLAVPCGVFVRHADIWFRRQNHRFIPWVTRCLEQGHENVLGQAVVLSLLFWFLKAWGLFWAFGILGRILIDKLLLLCSPRTLLALDFAGRVLPLLGFCVVLNYFVSRSRFQFSWIDKSPNP